MKSYFFLLLAITILFCTAEAETFTYSRTINWSDTAFSTTFSDYKTREVPFFNNAVFDDKQFGFLPLYSEQFELPFYGEINAVVSDEVYQDFDFSKFDQSIFNNLSIKKWIVSIGTEQKKTVGDFLLLPFRIDKQNGKVQRLVSFTVSVNLTPENNRSNNLRTYASNSVLSTGTWYKIAIQKDGVYKLDKDFLESLGINTNQINPKNIRIFGNGGEMLPEPNSSFRYDDLQENAIEVVGETDGTFDNSDYVLFYGEGPDVWSYNSSTPTYNHTTNLYSKYSYYFLTVDNGNGLRIPDQQSLGVTPDNNVTAFDSYAFHELDTVSLIESGRDWYGELFEFIPTQSFTFSTPGSIGSGGILTTDLALRSTTTNTSFSVYINNVLAGVASANSVCPDYTCNFASATHNNYNFNSASGSTVVTLTYNNNGDNTAQGYLNYLELKYRRQLTMNANYVLFQDASSFGAGIHSKYILSNASSAIKIWDVTNPIAVKNQTYNLNGSTADFTVLNDTLKHFIAFNNQGYLVPVSGKKIQNQNLHGIQQLDFAIVAPQEFLNEAQQLADFHKQIDPLLTVKVIDAEEIYNEFSSGKKDITAIRDFMKMLYDRAGSSNQIPKYLLLFGDGTVDNKDLVSTGQNFIPTYQSVSSLSPVSSFTSDDFYGFLDDIEGSNILNAAEKLDIGIGRLPVNSEQQAQDMVNKIMHYASTENFGNWRNDLAYIADDEDYNQHFNDAERVDRWVAINYPVYNINKIYLDAYQQETTPGGGRYPDVTTAIDNQIYSGCLMVNYVGHGGVAGLAHERILGVSDFQNWTNFNKLPLFVTATCEFSRYDEIGATSAGEYLLLNANGGAIALVTTLRLVYSSANYDLNSNFTRQIFAETNGQHPTLGYALMNGKNNVTTDATNNRKFTLLGDPALTLNYPKLNVYTTQINGHDAGTVQDTMKALQKITVAGKVTDEAGNTLAGFNGIVYPTIFDKKVTYYTLANDPTSFTSAFQLQKNIIYNGKASVTNGVFSFSFIVPKDISYNFGAGKISYYADNNFDDANGYDTSFIVGGTADTFAADNKGPLVDLFMNNLNFVFGGTTDQNPYVLVKLSDENGINTTGTGIGHDITGTLDDNSQNTFVMNDFYESDLDSYQSGQVKYPLINLEDGLHNIRVKAWDVYNNSGVGYTEFVVASNAQMALTHVLNYPNPFTTNTQFMFETNITGGNMHVKIDIYSIQGNLIKTISQDVSNDGYRVAGINWDGKDDFGDNIGRGVYIYKITVTGNNGMQAQSFQKLVILK